MNIGAETRYLLEMAFNVAVEFYIATACLRAGGTCIWDRSRRVPDAITHHGATHAALFVGSLAQNIRHLPTSFTKPAGFTIRSFGGPLIAELRTKTLARLADTVIESYGTNEVPAVADMAPDGTGDILSDVSVEIIDEDDNPVIGVAGTIRIQSPYMVTQYLNDPSASQERFRDGWFYPGDYGVMPEPGKLQVLGRTDDLLNIHGIKLHPANLEAQVAEIDDVAEAAITSLTQTDGGSHVCVCLVLEPDRKPADVIEAVSAALPPIISEASVIQVTLIPKTKNGKIQRRKLDELLLEAILSQADDAP
jgi:acyl-coenzyme A synthetase/AMP-(fatty) acid ligase